MEFGEDYIAKIAVTPGTIKRRKHDVNHPFVWRV